MPIDSISNYQSPLTKGSTKSNTQSINVEDFLTLISAQLKNQDMMNPMSDTEFISQLAQFTSLEISQTLADNQSISLALNFMGKEVTAVNTTSTGQLDKVTGTVDKVTLFEGVPMIHVKDQKFSMYQIMEINNILGGN